MNKLKLISLFAGIGAVEMAAKRVFDEVEIVAAAEIDKFARQSYKAIHEVDEDHYYTDVRKMDGSKYKGLVDCVAFGFPCQDYSIAGKRAGLEGQRGTLFYEGARIVKEVRPSFFVAENVKGLLSSNGGKDFEIIMDILRNELGYYCHWEVLNSKDYGVPQNRERVFIVGFLDHEAYYRFQFAPKVPLTKRLKDVLESEVDEKYYINRELLDYKSQANTIHDTERESPTICAGTHGYALGYINEGVIGMLDIKGNDQTRRVYGTDGSAPCLQTMQEGNREPKILDDQGRKRKQENPVLHDHCPTLRAQTHGNEPKVVLNGDYRIRKLTPLECWRLQDFPDEAHEKAKQSGVSDSQRYKQAGNSITVAVMEMILRQVEKALSRETSGSLF